MWILLELTRFQQNQIGPKMGLFSNPTVEFIRNSYKMGIKNIKQPIWLGQKEGQLNDISHFWQDKVLN